MTGPSPLETTALFHVGAVPISDAVVTTWAIMAALSVASWLGTRRLARRPGRWQSAIEVVVETLLGQIGDILRREATPFLPLLGTLFIFLVVANLVSIIPGVVSPTAHIETDAALALIVLVSVHGFGIRALGLWGHLKSYAKPNPMMLPLNVIAEITRTLALMVRLFGNIVSHEIVIGVVVILAGLLVPVPLMLLSVLLGLVQAYIFTVLAAVFISAAVGTMEESRKIT